LINIAKFISNWTSSYFNQPDASPWHLTTNAPQFILDAIKSLSDGIEVNKNIAIHATASVEKGSIIKGPAIIGPNCYIAATAYLRGGVFLENDCIVGPACELKSTFMFSGSKIAHLSFVGDSLIGSLANIEAGAIIANYRNEMADKNILIQTDDGIINTGVDKFGAIIGDNARIGANSVIAPGALISPGTIIPRLALIDQHPAVRE